MSGAARTLPEDYGDPFGATADPSRYVPREATEHALVELEQAVLDQESSALLVGLPGIGKTLILRLLRRRLAGPLEMIHLPYAALPPAALANWALNEMRVPSSWDPVGALAMRARNAHLEGRGAMVLLIDDAEVLPEETARALADMVRDARGGLRFVAAVDEEGADRLDRWLGDVAWVRLVAPMNAAETFQYVHTRLHASDLPERAFEAFGPDVVADLHARSGGIPGRVGAEASAVLLRVLRPNAQTAVVPSEAALPDESDQVLESLFADPRTPPPGAEPEAHASPPVFTEPEPVPSPLPVTAPEPDAPLPPLTVPEPDAPLPPLTVPEPEPEPDVSLPFAPEPDTASHPRSQEAVPGETDDPDAALERAAGRLALAHTDVASAEVSPSLERAAGRLALAQEAAPDASVPRPSEGAASGRWRLLRMAAVAAGVFALFFVAGGVVGRFLGLDELLEGESESTAQSEPTAPPGTAPRSPATPAPAPGPATVERPPPPAPVRVQINAVPWARIQVDGVEVGVTPLAGVPLEPGPRRFVADFPDGTRVERVEEISGSNRWVVFP